MKSELDKEKRAMKKIWAKREKQIEAIEGFTTDMLGSVGGIAGDEGPKILTLELGDDLHAIKKP